MARHQIGRARGAYVPVSRGIWLGDVVPAAAFDDGGAAFRTYAAGEILGKRMLVRSTSSR